MNQGIFTNQGISPPPLCDLDVSCVQIFAKRSKPPCPKRAWWCSWVSVLCWSQAIKSISSDRWSYGGSVCQSLRIASGHPESSPPLLPCCCTQTLSSSTVVLSERPCWGSKRPRLRCCHLPLKWTLSNRINTPKWGERSAFPGGKTTVNNKNKQKEKMQNRLMWKLKITVT